jgi:hypothetical protein
MVFLFYKLVASFCLVISFRTICGSFFVGDPLSLPGSLGVVKASQVWQNYLVIASYTNESSLYITKVDLDTFTIDHDTVIEIQSIINATDELFDAYLLVWNHTIILGTTEVEVGDENIFHLYKVNPLTLAIEQQNDIQYDNSETVYGSKVIYILKKFL